MEIARAELPASVGARRRCLASVANSRNGNLGELYLCGSKVSRRCFSGRVQCETGVGKAPMMGWARCSWQLDCLFDKGFSCSTKPRCSPVFLLQGFF